MGWVSMVYEIPCCWKHCAFRLHFKSNGYEFFRRPLIVRFLNRVLEARMLSLNVYWIWCLDGSFLTTLAFM